jgi:hypothetical protein
MNGVEKNQIKLCKFLGLKEDPAVCFSYPCKENNCFKINNPEPISINQQELFCMSGLFNKCEIYQTLDISHMPKATRNKEYYKLKRSGLLRRLLIFSLFIVAVVFFSWIFIESGNPISNQAFLYLTEETYLTEMYTMKLTPSTPQYPTQVPTEEVLSTKTPTATFYPTETPLPTLVPNIGPDMLTPFGPNNQFLLHHVQHGDSLWGLAYKYSSTIEVITSINMIYGAIWIDQVLVIMPGQLTADNLDLYQVIQLEEEISITNISSQYNVSVETLRYINGIGTDNILPADRWLIVPFY